MKTFTRQQLALRNGQDKPEIWVAYRGVIYDVSESRLWKNGKHYEHWAGQDLTEELYFLERYDELKRALQDLIDMPDRRLNEVIIFLHQNKGIFQNDLYFQNDLQFFLSCFERYLCF